MPYAPAKIRTIPGNFEFARENANARESGVPSALERFHVSDDVPQHCTIIENIFERKPSGESPFSIQLFRLSSVTLLLLTVNVPRLEIPFSPGPIFFASLSAKWQMPHF